MDEERSIPAVTGEQMAKVDRIMMEELGLDVLQIMELAGEAVAAFARTRFLEGDPRGRRVLVLAGSGGNGGDGMVAARRLHGWGANVIMQSAREPYPGSVTDHQLRVLRNLGVEARPPAAGMGLPDADLIIDALLGFSLHTDPSGETKALIEYANARSDAVLAVDLPSGLGATDGTIYHPCIKADATLTLGLPKTGLLVPEAAQVVGELFVADIGVPAAAYSQLGLHFPPIFATSFWRAVPSQEASIQHQ